jgi:hypothetical protein
MLIRRPVDGYEYYRKFQNSCFADARIPAGVGVYMHRFHGKGRYSMPFGMEMRQLCLP